MTVGPSFWRTNVCLFLWWTKSSSTFGFGLGLFVTGNKRTAVWLSPGLFLIRTEHWWTKWPGFLGFICVHQSCCRWGRNTGAPCSGWRTSPPSWIPTRSGSWRSLGKFRWAGEKAKTTFYDVFLIILFHLCLDARERQQETIRQTSCWLSTKDWPVSGLQVRLGLECKLYPGPSLFDIIIEANVAKESTFPLAYGPGSYCIKFTN